MANDQLNDAFAERFLPVQPTHLSCQPAAPHYPVAADDIIRAITFVIWHGGR